MTQSTTERSSQSSDQSVSKTSGGLVTEQGRTTIADAVVSKIAGIAAREVSGVYDLGGGAARAVGAVRDRIQGARTNHSQGISVEVGERETAVDISLVAEYGVAIADLAAGIRRNIIASIERMTGLEVTEVNVEVTDIHVASDDDQDSGDSSGRS